LKSNSVVEFESIESNIYGDHMALVGIVAVDQNLAIGKGGALPWHYSADMKFFRAQTTGHICVMGHHTWRSLKKPLPDRLNVVLTRELASADDPSVLFIHGPETVQRLAQFAREDIFVIGGARTYEIFAPDITRWIVTLVPLSVEGADVHMPADFLKGFQEKESRDLGEGLIARFYERTDS
jgi:dihydrofolate reductase